MFSGKALISYKGPDLNADPVGHSIKSGTLCRRFLGLFAGIYRNRQQGALGDRLS